MKTCTNDVSIKADIEAHLGLRDLGYHTHYLVALEEARHLSGRDIKTGHYNPHHKYVGFLGLLGYLCLIDHLGGVFSPKNPSRPSPSPNDFKRLLYEFTSLSSDEISALYGLRCSLAHNFSQTNTDPRNLYCFTIARSLTEPLHTPALVKWDGVFRESVDNPYQYHTKINSVKVGDLVEDIHKSLIHHHQNLNLECLLNQPSIEMITRYSFIIRTK